MRKSFVAAAIAAAALSTPVVAAQTVDAAPRCLTNVVVDGTGSVNGSNSVAHYWAPDAVRIQYPGSFWPLGAYNYDQSVAMGVVETKRVVRAERAKGCDVHITGHSQGARVAGDAIAELAAEDGDVSYVSADLLSDPRHAGHGVEVMVPLGVPGYRMSGERAGFGNARVNTVCVAGDPICDFPNLVADPGAVFDVVPNYLGLHGAYPVGVVNEVPVVPGPVDVVRMPALPPLPPLPNVSDGYRPIPVSEYVPVELRQLLPAGVLGFVPPPLPPMPGM